MIEKTLWALIAFLTLLVIIPFPSEYEVEQKAEHKSYCELVLMWEEDAELGIEPTKRDGMPNYKEIDCEL